MIRVSLASLVLIYLFAFLALIFSLWFAYERHRKRKGRAAVDPFVRCRMCGLEFEDSTKLDIVSCPRCASRNARSRNQLK